MLLKREDFGGGLSVRESTWKHYRENRENIMVDSIRGWTIIHGRWWKKDDRRRIRARARFFGKMVDGRKNGGYTIINF